jgi:glutamate synthase (ferredoxin)
VTANVDVELLESLIKRHVELTASQRGRDILNNWDYYLPLFWKVAPHLALSEEGPMTVVHRHLDSIKAGAH